MMLVKNLLIAFLIMRKNPVRALLSMLGIYIGVLALTAILALHEGMRRNINEVYATSGANILLIRSAYDQARQKMGRVTLDDVEILKSVPGAQSVTPRLNTFKNVRGAKETADLNVMGIDQDFLRIYRVPLKSGRAFLGQEIKSKHPVALLTEASAQKLFPLARPLGSLINVEGQIFEVIGVVAWNAGINTRALLEEPGVLVPLGWMITSETQDQLHVIEFRADPVIPEARIMKTVLSQLTHGESLREPLYYVQSVKEFIRQEQELSRQNLGSLLAMGIISLLVGGIGIANVMLISVTERTREIGIRKALGAKRTDILFQFLVESALLTVTGGILAVTTTGLATAILLRLHMSNTPLAIPFIPTLGCLAITVAIGLIAGIYPASRAAARSPADALRYE